MQISKLVLFIVLCFYVRLSIAQNIPTRLDYPKMLWTSTDSFYVLGSSWEGDTWTLTTTKSDTVDLGTDGYQGGDITVWTDHDTVTIPYVNAPFEQWVFIPVGSPNDTTIYRLRFNERISKYTNAYVAKNNRQINISIPEVYELANIILYLSECSKLTYNHNENLEYAKRVETYFADFKEHPLIQVLNDRCGNGGEWATYYGFRENSVCYTFSENNQLVYNTVYKHVYWDNSETKGGEFRHLLYLVQDFVNQTNFRTFFQENKSYYQQLEELQKQLLPIQKMWVWLEKEFPERFNAYRVVFSPLIEGSHSTQKYYRGVYKNPTFQECVMFINAPEQLASKSEYSDKLKEGLMSGIVFTEIDHNYVNPASKEKLDLVKALIEDKDFWATKGAQEHYASAYSIFNEYMTHALFCLYIKEHYEGFEQEEVIRKRIQLMNRRGYPRFEAFTNILLDQMEDRTQTVYDSYASIIQAMETILE